MENGQFVQYFMIPLLMTLFTQVLSKLEYVNPIDIVYSLREIDLKNFFKTRYTILLKGERIRSVCQYSGNTTIVESFTNTFSALWEYIIKQNDNKNILELTELNSNSSSKIDKEQKTFYYVSQKNCFIINKELELYGKSNVTTTIEPNENKKNGKSNDCHYITIELFSYSSKITDIKKFLNKITDEYTEKIKTIREKNRYIYSIKQVEYEEYYQDCWYESIFSTTRTFNNLFFNEKETLLKKLDFFLNNKDWYYKKGVPYTLGIGLSGEPGTGKTSIIKAIAQYTDRHVINLSMKLFKTRKQLYQFFFETTYNRKNITDSITYDKKIIVIEDIDCLGDIVLKRKQEYKIKKNEDTTTKMLQTLLDKSVSDSSDEVPKNSLKLTTASDPITLDDILNIFDGIQEHFGRIMIITSNHYDKLDPALIRPGRIDIKLEMANLSCKTIQQIYNHLYEKSIPKNMIHKLPEYKYTPAKLMNIYLNNQDDEKSFLREICKGV